MMVKRVDRYRCMTPFVSRRASSEESKQARTHYGQYDCRAVKRQLADWPAGAVCHAGLLTFEKMATACFSMRSCGDGMGEAQ